jgi:hypothetical protein
VFKIGPTGGEGSDEEGNLIKSKKWSDREHLLYILFLEENREKTKSKLIRR